MPEATASAQRAQAAQVRGAAIAHEIDLTNVQLKPRRLPRGTLFQNAPVQQWHNALRNLISIVETPSATLHMHVYVRMYVYTYIQAYIHTYIPACTRRATYMHIYAYTYTHIHMHRIQIARTFHIDVHLHIHVHSHLPIRMHKHFHMRIILLNMHVCIHRPIHIHVLIRTLSLSVLILYTDKCILA